MEGESMNTGQPHWFANRWRRLFTTWFDPAFDQCHCWIVFELDHVWEAEEQRSFVIHVPGTGSIKFGR